MENSINIKRRIQLPAKTKQILFDCIAYAFLILFLFTAIEKFMDNAAFVKSLKQYPFLKGYEIWISYLVPASELAVSILLFFPKTRKLGIYASLALMIILTIGLLIIINTTGLSNCGCSGYLAKLSAAQHILFNGIFIALGITAILLTTTSFQPKRRDLFAIVATLSIIAIPLPLRTIDCILYIRFIEEAPLSYNNIKGTLCGIPTELESEAESCIQIPDPFKVPFNNPLNIQIL